MVTAQEIIEGLRDNREVLNEAIDWQKVKQIFQRNTKWSEFLKDLMDSGFSEPEAMLIFGIVSTAHNIKAMLHKRAGIIAFAVLEGLDFQLFPEDEKEATPEVV